MFEFAIRAVGADELCYDENGCKLIKIICVRACMCMCME